MEKNTTTKNNFKKIFVSEEMSSSYLSYAMSVIVSRLPDVRWRKTRSTKNNLQCIKVI